MTPPISIDTPSGTILGVGVDLIEITRIKEAIERHGESFLAHVFTKEEREYCEKLPLPWASYAARFAAKEAVSKAFGTGIGAELSLTGIGVISDERGAPKIKLDEKGEKLLRKKNATAVHISLTHTNTHAMAFALLSQ